MKMPRYGYWMALPAAALAVACLAPTALGQDALPPAPAQPVPPPPPIRAPSLPQIAEQAGAPAFRVISGPLSVEEAVKVALTESPMLRQAQEEVARAKAQIGSARALTRFRLSTTLYGATGNMDNILTTSPGVEPADLLAMPRRPFGDFNLMAMYPLYTGGKLGAAMREAEARYGASDASRRSAQLDIGLEVRQRYYQALQAAEIVKAYEQWVAAAEENVRVTQERYDVGKTPLYDVLRAQTDLANVVQELTNARSAAEVALAALRTAMGVDLTSAPTLTDSLATQVTEATLSAELEAAEKDRPELAEAGQLIAAQAQAVAQARAAYDPQVYGIGMNDLQTGREIGTRGGYTVGVVASLPLLDGGGRRSYVNEQEAELRRLESSRRGIRLEVRNQVSGAWVRLHAAQQNVLTSQAALAQAQEDYRIASLRYETGKGILVERLDALTALVRAQVNNLNARYELAAAKAELDRAVGRGT